MSESSHDPCLSKQELAERERALWQAEPEWQRHGTCRLFNNMSLGEVAKGCAVVWRML